MQLTYSPEQQQAWLDQHRPMVQEKVSGPVQAFSIFQRANGFGALAAGYASPLAASIIRAAGKRKAGGLPQSFLLVATDTKVHALAFKFKRSGMSVRQELAVWDRAAIRTSVEDKRLTKRLTIESPGEGETVVCEASKAEITDRLIEAVGATPAAA